ncbi:hypothetical protein [Spiroplasma endosymbiont of Danaus chrysippus]|uniref:hypothetical protein n=1 Tax=Spiroplasma endosymbiont of Danaus chrysippus TaxID=2691041 RepID=UPI00157AA8FE|nr:hypothetical protein [Spiroplasma endosymbiont of Danaus chrysippus]
MGEVIITIDLLRRANIIIDLVSIENDFGDPLTTEDLKEHDTHVKLTLTDEGKNHFIGENNDLKVNWVPEV